MEKFLAAVAICFWAAVFITRDISRTRIEREKTLRQAMRRGRGKKAK